MSLTRGTLRPRLTTEESIQTLNRMRQWWLSTGEEVSAQPTWKSQDKQYKDQKQPDEGLEQRVGHGGGVGDSVAGQLDEEGGGVLQGELPAID